MKINRNFPNDAITCVAEMTGTGTFNCTPGGVSTILFVGSQQSGTQSDTTILCGSNIVAKNYATALPYHDMSYLCEGSIIISKTGGGDSSTTSITYVPYNLRAKEDFGFEPLALGLGFIIGFLMVAFFAFYFRRKQ
jgi:hypothetical protein